MTEVKIQSELKQADPDTVWTFAKQIDQYPKFMPQVLSVDVISNNLGDFRTAWRALFNGNELRWIEQNTFDDAKRRMEFVQLEGDLYFWKGSLEILTESNRVWGRYNIEFDLGVPALEQLLHPLAANSIRNNCEEMLATMSEFAHS